MSSFKKTAKKIEKANGIKTIPGLVGRKGPALKGWEKFKRRKPTSKEFETWCEDYPEYNICMNLGKVSDVIAVDIDVDEKKHPELFQEIIEALPPSAIKKVGRKGQTAFFKYAGEKTKVYRDEFGDVAVEILSTGKTTDLPPSIHPDTKKSQVYITEDTFEDDDSVKLLEELDGKFIDFLEEKFGSNKPTKKNTTGRESTLRKMAIAALNKEKSIEMVVKELRAFDEKNHETSYFSDNTEFPKTSKKPNLNAKKFVTSISKTLDEEDDYDGLKVLTLADLNKAGKKNINWLVEDLLPKPGISLLAGPPKEGKSQLARYCATCVLNGSPFLRRKTKKGSVVLGLFEESPELVHTLVEKVGIKESDDFVILANEQGKNAPRSLKKYLKKFKPDFVIIDTLQAFSNMENVNDYSRVVPDLLKLREIAYESDTHIMLIHHTRKGGDGSPDSILGSIGFYSTVDTTLLIHNKQGDKKRFLTTKQRYSANNYSDAVLTVSSNLRFSVFKSNDSYNIHRISTKILNALDDRELTKVEIKDYVSANAELFNKSLKRLIDKKKIEKFGEGQKGKPYKYKVSIKKEVGTRKK